MRPVRIVLTPPLEPFPLAEIHASLAEYDDRASARRQLIRCAWQQGASLLADQAIPGTEVATHLFGRWPLGASDDWLICGSDSLGRWQCEVSDDWAVDFARRHDISHLAVPRRFRYTQPDSADSSTWQLVAEVAVVDVLERRVVWSGPVVSNLQDLAIFDGLTPQLTAVEKATYAWLVTLFRTFDRIEAWPNEDLDVLARCCHELPPVFDWPKAEAASDSATHLSASH
jgi:hypothetical protein